MHICKTKVIGTTLDDYMQHIIASIDRDLISVFIVIRDPTTLLQWSSPLSSGAAMRGGTSLPLLEDEEEEEEEE